MMPEYQDMPTSAFADLARESSSELGAIDLSLIDYERGWTAWTGDAKTNMFLASAREIVLELVRRLNEKEASDATRS